MEPIMQSAAVIGILFASPPIWRMSLVPVL
jgi:hypothetical protein